MAASSAGLSALLLGLCCSLPWLWIPIMPPLSRWTENTTQNTSLLYCCHCRYFVRVMRKVANILWNGQELGYRSRNFRFLLIKGLPSAAGLLFTGHADWDGQDAGREQTMTTCKTIWQSMMNTKGIGKNINDMNSEHLQHPHYGKECTHRNNVYVRF